ncbi:type VI secretion system baseplate subunit TssG [Pseudomonas sp. LS44]|uniref:type VI secretion system baseplate subunit TssG n=1 Tax=Pseudomonas sp. LS44 TaxID=1357074 RepID=UPI00215A950B|nr:type VI secretion system baseplate subunit TssG [Pseudomonas sp. LS44]UVE17751.1 type VI secretion system baseplate subunit TssG [Pseudomonas sp. LS44]
MDTTHGPTAAALNRLSGGIREYNLFKGIEGVLERLHAEQAGAPRDDEALYARLEFHANPSLGFAGSDIDRLEFFREHGELRARLRINLVSLSGAVSPLPAFYADQALGDDTTREFLDLFHQRLQRLLLPIWRKYRYHARFRDGAQDPLSAQLFALIGLGGDAIRASEELNWKRLLPYLGLLSLRARSAALIEAVLRYYFKHAELHIEQCLERQVTIRAEQLGRLGQANNRLADSLVLGETVRDRGGKFRIHVQQLSWQRFHDFLPIGEGYRPLCALVRFVLRDPLDYDLCLQLRHDQLRELRIGTHNPCRLGWTSWLGHEQADPVVTLGSRLH